MSPLKLGFSMAAADEWAGKAFKSKASFKKTFCDFYMYSFAMICNLLLCFPMQRVKVLAKIYLQLYSSSSSSLESYGCFYYFFFSSCRSVKGFTLH